MKTIVPAAELVTRILGKQRRQAGLNYRLLRFCIQCPVEDGTLIYNPLTLELLLLSTSEMNSLTENEELISKWFLVPKEQDDYALADHLHDIAVHVQKPVDYINHYTILTTTNCNARCYYCFEQGCVRKNMSKDTASRLAQYITEHIGDKKAQLHWFGGEPLANQEAIDTICQELTNAGVRYCSSIASNGYLFDKPTIQKAKDIWHLEKAQITLDGTEEVYNRTKAFLCPDGSPFQRVLNNIELLQNSGINVSIRLNVGEENWQDLLRLADQLAERFKGQKGFFVYPSPLHDKINDESKWVLTHSSSLADKFRKVRDRLIQLELYGDGRLARSIKVTQCIANNDGAVVVLPDGKLGCCEHFLDSEIYGDINSEERDYDMLVGWKERTPAGQECFDCSYYPQCYRLKKCPGGRTCTEIEREMMEKRLRSQILNEYYIYTSKNTVEWQDYLSPENC
ncbi:MAG: 4Fe-4S cluster-binding domain-containing protein [Oscillospiraceae bacterium]|nr:4Fe-4S cluster-binding domain-containing protein [Oscillospiraceae bacterium]